MGKMRGLKIVRMKLERRCARKDDILNFSNDKLLLIEHNSRNWLAILLISLLTSYIIQRGETLGKKAFLSVDSSKII